MYLMFGSLGHQKQTYEDLVHQSAMVKFLSKALIGIACIFNKSPQNKGKAVTKEIIADSFLFLFTMCSYSAPQEFIKRLQK